MKEERLKQDASAQNEVQCPTKMNSFMEKIIGVTREKDVDDRIAETHQFSINKSDEEFYLSKMLEWLMPWSKKSGLGVDIARGDDDEVTQTVAQR